MARELFTSRAKTEKFTRRILWDYK
ncbi:MULTISPECIES: DUF1661 domain-containing protein [Porphyromonas]|nr:DUF1661 domain-containing protein [Porphyromonas gulae]